jgi:CheY-like chemotaxis protein
MFDILYVDNCANKREFVKQLFDADWALTVTTCAGEADAIEIATRWAPDVLLCDAGVPGQDACALLSRWQSTPSTMEIPVVLTADPEQVTQLTPFTDSGLVRVLIGPADPSTIIEVVRDEIRASQMRQLRRRFSQRLAAEEVELKRYGETLRDAAKPATALDELSSRAHKLAGAAGIYGFEEVSRAASHLEMAISPENRTESSPLDVSTSLDNLLVCIAGAKSEWPAAAAANRIRQS